MRQILQICVKGVRNIIAETSKKLGYFYESLDVKLERQPK